MQWHKQVVLDKGKNNNNQTSLYPNSLQAFERLHYLHAQEGQSACNILHNKVKTSSYLHNNSILEQVPEHSFVI